MSFPKILIFGQPFNRVSGGGITLSNLFAGWDKDKIAVASTGHMLTNIETDTCNHYYQLGSKEHRWIFPFNKFQQKYKSGVLKINNFNSKESKTKRNNLRKNFVDNFFFPVLKYFGIYYRLSSISLSREFCKWLDEYNPDILYVQASDRDAILFVKKLHAFLKKPMVIHVMDDWPSIISSKGLFRKYWREKIDLEFRNILNSSSLLLSISDSMALEYGIRYNKNFITFHNPIDLEFWKTCQKNDYELKESPSILYAGRIGIGIEKSLQLIAESIKRINEELKISMKFILQTREKPAWFGKYNCIVHSPFVEYKDLPKIFSEADFLILPYDFSLESTNFIKYSMPTKAPEYMICGTPILIFAPELTAVVKYACQARWAKVITKNNSTDLANAIKSLIANKNERIEIARTAKLVAEKNHDSIIVVHQFRKTICSLVSIE